MKQKAVTKAKPKAKGKAFRILEEADVPIGDLVEDTDNANIHTEENLQAIQASFKKFGQVKRFVVRKSDSIVFAGNGGTTVLQRLGLPTARVQYVEGSDVECRAYAVADNQTTRMSKWDDELLLANLQEIQEADTTGLLASTGFTLEDVGDLENLLADLKPKGKKGLAHGKGGTLAVCPACSTEFRIGTKVL